MFCLKIGASYGQYLTQKQVSAIRIAEEKLSFNWTFFRHFQDVVLENRRFLRPVLDPKTGFSYYSS